MTSLVAPSSPTADGNSLIGLYRQRGLQAILGMSLGAADTSPLTALLDQADRNGALGQVLAQLQAAAPQWRGQGVPAEAMVQQAIQVTRSVVGGPQPTAAGASAGRLGPAFAARPAPSTASAPTAGGDTADPALGPRPDPTAAPTAAAQGPTRATGPAISFDATQRGQSTDLSSEEWAYLSRILGSDAQVAYQNFIANYGLTFTPSAAQSGAYTPALLGVNFTGAPSASTAYPSLAQPGGQTAPQPLAVPGSAAAVDPNNRVGQALLKGDVLGQAPRQGQFGPLGPHPLTDITPREWATFLQHSIYGTAAFMSDRVASLYKDDTGQDMPADLRKQVTDAIRAAPADEQQAMLASLTGDPSKFAYPSFISTMVKSYEAAHPAPSSELAARRTYLDYTFTARTGQHISDSQLQTLLHASDTEVTQYIDNMPSNVRGLTWGTHDAELKRLTAYWHQYFGPDRQPTDAELVRFAHVPDDQLQEFINNSPSHIPGVTLGRYTAIKKFADDLSLKFFHQTAQPHDIAAIHSADLQAQGGPTP